MPSLRFWQHAAQSDAIRHQGALFFSTGTVDVQCKLLHKGDSLALPFCGV